jgi:hypothetical protein
MKGLAVQAPNNIMNVVHLSRGDDEEPYALSSRQYALALSPE